MVGMIICMLVGVFFLPWAAVMSRVMLRKEHRSPVLSSISLLGGGLTAWILAEFPGKILDVAYYGSSQPGLQEFIWRGAWFGYDMTYMVTGLRLVVVGIHCGQD